MKPGCVKFNRGGYHFDNGCSAIYRPASIDALQGYTIDTLFIDEFAYIRNTQARQFWNNVYPTLSSMSNSRVMITSTPNGRNLFYELWSNAIDGKNFFKPLRIDWWEVPGRDEKWRLQEIANLGSEAAFAQQYGLSFDTGVKNSLSAETFHYLNKVSTEFEHDIFKIGTDWDEYFRWSTKWMYNLRKDWFLISIDIGEGLGGDYSVIKIRKLFLNPDGTVIMPTIGVFECNTIIVEDFAKVILLMMRRFNPDHVRLIIERNSYGDLLIKDIESLAEHLTNVEIPVETFAKFRRSADNMKMEKGIRLNRGNKKVGVGNWKKLVDDKIFIETDSRTIDQYREFGEDKNGNYKAGVGHDDLVMPDVNAAFYVKSNNTGWNEFIEDFKEHVTIDSFNTEVMIRYNLVAINEIKKDSAFEGNEYEIIPLEELTDEDIANEYSEIDKYLELPSEKNKSKKLKEYESYNTAEYESNNIYAKNKCLSERIKTIYTKDWLSTLAKEAQEAYHSDIHIFMKHWRETLQENHQNIQSFITSFCRKVGCMGLKTKNINSVDNEMNILISDATIEIRSYNAVSLHNQRVQDRLLFLLRQWYIIYHSQHNSFGASLQGYMRYIEINIRYFYVYDEFDKYFYKQVCVDDLKKLRGII